MTLTGKKNQFMRLFLAAEQDLYRYILILVPHEADALDILQETAHALWEKFGEYDATRPFGPWARKFAYMGVLKFRLYRAREREKRAPFSDQALEALSREYDKHEEVLDLRLTALAHCFAELPAEDRELVEQRYWSKTNLGELAARRGVREDRLYRRLQRVRQILQRCIEHTVSCEESS